ncbi:MAG: hypothetical protein V4537_14600 [Pseudomonadota bacterium]
MQRRRARPQRATKRSPGKVPGSGGPSRGPEELADLVDETEKWMLYSATRENIAEALGQHLAQKQVKLAAAQGRTVEVVATPLPLGTVDDYIRRVKDRWAANPLPDREDARERTRRRLFGQIRSLIGKGNHPEVAKREALLMKVEGTEVAKRLEISAPGGAPIELKTGDGMLDMLKKLAGEKG